MRALRRAWPAAGLLLLGACVSLEEAPMAKRPLSAQQRLLLIVYAAPGPMIAEADSKAETAAKIIPGLGLVVKDVQDQRDLKAAQDLQQYLPGWDPAGAFDSAFRKQVDALGQPAKLIGPGDTGLPADTWLKLNPAKDALDWRARYQGPPREGPPPRNYSRFLQLDDAVVLEVNLAYGLQGLEGDRESLYAPSVTAVTKLVRANVMQPLWRRETTLTEAGAAKTLYDFKVAPAELISAWQRLLPSLGSKVAEELRNSLTEAGVALDPYRAQRETAEAQSQPGGLPMGPGWAPAPVPQTTVSPEAQAASEPGAPFTPRPSTP